MTGNQGDLGNKMAHIMAAESMAHGPHAVRLSREEDTSNLTTHRLGITLEEMIQAYNKWAKAGTYEKDLCIGDSYNGPLYVAAAVGQYLERTSSEARILDVAAGTGLVGQQLNKLGFTNIDALEPAQEMLKVAKTRHVYMNLFCEVFGSEKTSLPDDEYDALVISGGMGEGHIPTRALTEMIRLVKPGGFVFIMMREEYLLKVADYRDRLEPFMARLQAAGVWQLAERTVLPRYSFLNNGVLYVYRVNTPGGAPITFDDASNGTP